MIKETHCFPNFHSLGGVEAMLNLHYELDAAFGFDSRFVVYYEKTTTLPDRVHPLGFDPEMKYAEAQRRVKAVVKQHPSEITVYHGLWGVPWLAPLDMAQRRVLVIHGKHPGLERLLIRSGHLFDGIAGTSDEVLEISRRALPNFPEDRRLYLPYAVRLPQLATREVAQPKKPVVIGFCSRLIVEQKRVDRLPQFIKELDKTGIQYRFEFLGDGPDRAWLEQEFPDRDRFVFHGRHSGLDYWRRLASWDCIYFCSDYEGTPISMLEALAVGVVPLFPGIGCGGDRYVASVRPENLYEPGNMAQAAAAFEFLAKGLPHEWQEWRAKAIRSVVDHVGDAYFSRFRDFLNGILAREPISTKNFEWRGFPLNQLTFNGANCVDRWRGKIRKWMRRSD